MMTIKQLVASAFCSAKRKGLWDGTTISDAILHMRRETAEAYDAWQKYVTGDVAQMAWYSDPNSPRTYAYEKPTQDCVIPEGLPFELADVVILAASICGQADIDLEAAIWEKMAYNATRSYKHGKKQ